MSINSVTISGNITREPDYRVTAFGSQILSIGVAINDRKKNKEGQWEDYTHFVECVMFGARAESLAPILEKGMKVAIKGKLDYSTWVDKATNQSRSSLKVLIDDVDIMSQRRQQEDGAPRYERPAYQPPKQPEPQAARPVQDKPTIDAQQSVYDEDIPF